MSSRVEEHLQAIEAALRRIEEQLRQPVSIETLARQSGMSPWHFQRVFAALTGEPVGSYVRRRRLTCAAREILATKQRILDLALDYQFESHSAFTRAFRDVFGMSPAQVRRTQASPWTIRPPLTADRLRHLQRIQLQPEIVTLPALALDGLTTRFLSIVSERPDNTTVLPQLWRTFREALGGKGGSFPPGSYGAWTCLPRDEQSDPDELVYLAAIASSADVAPVEGFQRWTAPARRYAKFVHHGPISRIEETINHIYAVWLPNSPYERADGFDLERYGERFTRHEETSEMDYYVPLAEPRHH